MTRLPSSVLAVVHSNRSLTECGFQDLAQSSSSSDQRLEMLTFDDSKESEVARPREACLGASIMILPAAARSFCACASGKWPVARLW